MGIAAIGTLLSIGFTAVSSFVAAGQAQAQAAAAASAARANAQLQIDEIQRQQEEVNRISQEQKSDRIRAADRELGTLRVLAGERGDSAGTFSGLVRQIGFFEGLDLSRIETNRKNNIEAGQAGKKAAAQGAINTINIAANQAKVATVGAVLGGIGTSLQIGTQYYRDRALMDAERNEVA